MLKQINRFLRDSSGAFAPLWVFASIPVLAGVALSVDYSNMSRLKFELANATDAACSMVGRAYMAGTEKATLTTNANKFFSGNFDPNYLQYATMTLTLPDDAGNTSKNLSCKGKVDYHSMFGPMMSVVLNGTSDGVMPIINEAVMKMKNVAEIALVLDNSGSMLQDKTGVNTNDATKQRMALLKLASKKLVNDMIDLGAKIQQTSDPVKFSIVPFAGSVNVGTSNSSANWMDTRGINPTHHENLNWGTPSASNPTGFRSVAGDGAKLDASGNPLTRFTIYNNLKVATGGSADTSKCLVWKKGATTTGTGNANCAVFARTSTTETAVTSAAAATALSMTQTALQAKYSWQGCVESRPNGLDLTDEASSSSYPSSLFVPMFAPDDFNVSKYGTSAPDDGYNNWWPDLESASAGYWASPTDAAQVTSTSPTNASWISSTSRPREANAAKYFVKPHAVGSSGRNSQFSYFTSNEGPNRGCTTSAILPLTSSKTTVTSAIDAMVANGGTNIPEGLAWGWRTISSAAPFTEGVAESRKDIDKVVILLTDGFNTYGFNNTEFSAQLGYDVGGNKSLYGTWGVAGYAGGSGTNGIGAPTSSSNAARIFQNTSVSKTTYTNDNYTAAMEGKMQAICDNIKSQDVILMTVALDLDPNNYPASQKPLVNNAIDKMKACAGSSRLRKDANGVAEKLFWNAKSDNLNQTFAEIADELSNLRFTN